MRKERLCNLSCNLETSRYMLCAHPTVVGLCPCSRARAWSCMVSCWLLICHQIKALGLAGPVLGIYKHAWSMNVVSRNPTCWHAASGEQLASA